MGVRDAAANKQKYQQFRHALQQGQIVIGGWITLSDPKVAEIMAASGFDWVLVDLEHSSIAIDTAEQHIRAIKQTDTLALLQTNTAGCRSTPTLARCWCRWVYSLNNQ